MFEAALVKPLETKRSHFFFHCLKIQYHCLKIWSLCPSVDNKK